MNTVFVPFGLCAQKNLLTTICRFRLRTLRSCKQNLGARASCPLLVLRLLPEAKSGQDARAPRIPSQVSESTIPKPVAPDRSSLMRSSCFSRSSHWSVLARPPVLTDRPHRMAFLLPVPGPELPDADLSLGVSPPVFLLKPKSRTLANPESRTPVRSNASLEALYSTKG